jgi:hypothetical protein
MERPDAKFPVVWGELTLAGRQAVFRSLLLIAPAPKLWQPSNVKRRDLTLGPILILLGCARSEPQACQPPRSYWQKPHNFVGLRPSMNQISLLRDGSIDWNGKKVSSVTLSRYLDLSHKMNPEPDVFLQTEMGVPCRDVEILRDRMDRSLECKKSYSNCAEGILLVWKHLPTPAGSVVS